MNYTDFDNDAHDLAGLARLFRACLVLALMTVASCTVTVVKCCAQTHFDFNTATVIMVDTTGEMTVGNTSWPVRAWRDTLTAGPLMWYGVKWTETDGGHLWCITPFFRAHYAPGPGGKGLLVMPAGAVKTMEFLERTTYSKQ